MKKYFTLVLSIAALGFSLSGLDFVYCGVGRDSLVYAQEEKSGEVIKGEIICLGCTLKKEKGAKAQCSLYGHINGLRTSDGKIWTILENDNSTKLINSHELAGKKVEIEGKKYEDAHYIEVVSYRVLGE